MSHLQSEQATTAPTTTPTTTTATMTLGRVNITNDLVTQW